MKELSREEALDFLVAGMVDYNGSSFRCNMPEPKGWHYGVFGDQLKLHNNHLTDFITIQDWLDAKAKKESGVKLYIGDTPEQLKKGVTPTDQPYMPQVGEECEYTTNGEKWHICKPLCIGNKCIFVKSHKASIEGYKEYSLPIGDTEFRPIKTEREKLFDKCADTLNNIPQCNEVNSHHKDAIEWLIDAGLIHAPTTE